MLKEYSLSVFRLTIFQEDYPVDPKAFGESLRKAQIYAGVLIKEFAFLIGVTDNTVINRELTYYFPPCYD